LEGERVFGFGLLSSAEAEIWKMAGNESLVGRLMIVCAASARPVQGENRSFSVTNHFKTQFCWLGRKVTAVRHETARFLPGKAIGFSETHADD
jgi:hypothetical protein